MSFDLPSLWHTILPPDTFDIVSNGLNIHVLVFGIGYSYKTMLDFGYVRRLWSIQIVGFSALCGRRLARSKMFVATIHTAGGVSLRYKKVTVGTLRWGKRLARSKIHGIKIDGVGKFLRKTQMSWIPRIESLKVRLLVMMKRHQLASRNFIFVKSIRAQNQRRKPYMWEALSSFLTS
jgi:hypothetical protein